MTSSLHEKGEGEEMEGGGGGRLRKGLYFLLFWVAMG
jgi:hypothetical protein